LYERCIALQKSKEKKLNDLRVDKEKAEIQKVESYSYHPKTNNKFQPRSFEEYLAEKEIWTKRRKEELSRRKVELDAK
jgi:ABC-type transporter lipoprotein component MlaA